MKKRRFYINERLLYFKLDTFDYRKLNNRRYFQLRKNKLILNYYWNISHNVENIILFAYKKSKANWYKVLIDLNLIDIIKDYYNITTISKDLLWKLINDNHCRQCDKLINHDKIFCSNKCSNMFKVNDTKYINRLSNSIKKFHSELSDNEKNERNINISNAIKKINKKLSKNERKAKYTNKTLNYTSFDNLPNRFPNIYFLFDREYYYKNKFLPVKCEECGFQWDMTKTTTISRTICRKCNPYEKHKTQNEISDFISEFTNVKIDDRNVISNEIDIFIPKYNLAIEYDGLLNHSYGYSKVSYYNKFKILKNYHLNKTIECENKNIQLLHIFESDFLNKDKKNIWFSIIKNKINLNKRVFGRKCQIREVPSNIAKEFCNNNHLQGYAQSKINIGLYYNEELVSLMAFSKSRFNKNIEYELIRFCSKTNHTIVGGGSKLLKYFERNYNPKSIISYANKRWSNGNLYEKLGFEFIEDAKPNYYYFKENENILYSRNQFQKHKLPDKLDNFNPELTEIENMINNGYRIIYDCGNKKYIKYYE